MNNTLRAGLSLIALLLIITAGHAEKACGKWSTSFGSLAGDGEAWNASLCVEGRKHNLSLEATCMAQSINLRFMPEASDYLGDIDTVTVDYNVDGKSHLVKTQMEELDGALAADMPAKAPLITAMKAGNKLVISFPKNKSWPSYDVTLTGAKTAFTKLVQKCN